MVSAIVQQEMRAERKLDALRIATSFLVANGWHIEAVVWQMGRHSIDIIARRAGIVAFVQVVRLGGAAADLPIPEIRPSTRNIQCRVAALWALRFGRKDDTYRFDRIAVRIRRSGVTGIEHIEDAWRL